MPRQRVVNDPPKRGPESKPCDGTPEDYRRHSYYGEKACPASREAWRKAHRTYNKTGIYGQGIVDDADDQHPFMYRKPKRASRTRTAGKRRV